VSIGVLYTLITCLAAFARSVIIVITAKHVTVTSAALTPTMGVGRGLWANDPAGGYTVRLVEFPGCTGSAPGEADRRC
jgi:hypothetical protein